MAKLSLWKRTKKVTLADVQESLLMMLVTNEKVTREWLEARLSAIQNTVDEIRPVHLDLDQEVADAILEKFRSPLVIPQSMVDELRDGPGKYQFRYVSPPLGGNGPAFFIQVNADGSLSLELRSYSEDAPVWRATLSGPE